MQDYTIFDAGDVVRFTYTQFGLSESVVGHVIKVRDCKLHPITRQSEMSYPPNGRSGMVRSRYLVEMRVVDRDRAGDPQFRQFYACSRTMDDVKFVGPIGRFFLWISGAWR